VIKLYDYQVGSKFLSFRGSREALNENLVETILPFRLLDFRQKPDPKRTGDRAEGEFQGRSFRTSFRSFRDRLLNHRPREEFQGQEFQGSFRDREFQGQATQSPPSRDSSTPQ